ncbi:MAG: hypothetical protein CBB97_25815 [Candidatus Endolissoclinum sp. TMED37]|nr:MAG: hypothetical protein CBB97_25815 [Candidatus Endolissoclinum sp. TMED37]|tara:strand:- start:3972 stop:4226 length:255 start_codon:yes stop_codon:yes gene_type:complete
MKKGKRGKIQHIWRAQPDHLQRARAEQLQREGHYDKEWTVEEYYEWFCKQDPIWQNPDRKRMLQMLMRSGGANVRYTVYNSALD